MLDHLASTGIGVVWLLWLVVVIYDLSGFALESCTLRSSDRQLYRWKIYKKFPGFTNIWRNQRWPQNVNDWWMWRIKDERIIKVKKCASNVFHYYGWVAWNYIEWPGSVDKESLGDPTMEECFFLFCGRLMIMTEESPSLWGGVLEGEIKTTTAPPPLYP